jgi:hypothetical protein
MDEYINHQCQQFFFPEQFRTRFIANGITRTYWTNAPSPTIGQYHIVRAATMDDLAFWVNDLIQKGWRVLGGAVHSPELGFGQAMEYRP